MTNIKTMYDDIIDMPHHVSETHPQMSRHDRAAQFSPFAALTGYEDAVEEAGRLTNRRIVPDEEKAALLDRTMRKILENISLHPLIHAIYFIQDIRKTGGRYAEYTGRIRTFNEYNKILIFEDGTKIALYDIYDIEVRQKNCKISKK